MVKSWVAHFLSMILLPRLGTSLSLLFVSALISAAGRVDSLPEQVERALEEMKESHAALKARWKAVRHGVTVDEAALFDLYSRARTLLRALYDLLGSVIAVGKSDAEIAKEIQKRLFPDNMELLKWTIPRLFGEFNNIVEIIVDEYQARIVELGGERQWTALLEVHEEYSKKLGVTDRLARNDDPTLASLLQAMMNSVRRYVMSLVSWSVQDPSKASVVEEMLEAMGYYTKLSQEIFTPKKKDNANAPGQGTPGNGAPSQGAPGNGAPSQGAPANGAPSQGGPSNGAPPQGTPVNGSPNGAPPQGSPVTGGPSNGAPSQGTPNGAPAQGSPANGGPSNGAPAQGSPTNGGPPQGVPANGDSGAAPESSRCRPEPVTVNVPLVVRAADSA